MKSSDPTVLERIQDQEPESNVTPLVVGCSTMNVDTWSASRFGRVPMINDSKARLCRGIFVTDSNLPTDMSELDSSRITHGTDLPIHLQSLLDNVPAAMAALYQLHKALLNARSPDALVMKFSRDRHAIASEWEKWISTLEQCVGLIDDYILLTQSLSRQPRVTCLGFALENLDSTKTICQELDQHRAQYEGLLNDIAKDVEESRLKSLLVPAPSLSPSLIPHSDDSSAHQFIQTSLASLYPNGIQSFDASQESLLKTALAFSHIHAFWQDHQSRLAGMVHLLYQNGQAPTGGDLLQEILTWETYRTMLSRTIDAIALACDASHVDPKSSTEFVQPPDRDHAETSRAASLPIENGPMDPTHDHPYRSRLLLKRVIIRIVQPATSLLQRVHRQRCETGQIPISNEPRVPVSKSSDLRTDAASTYKASQRFSTHSSIIVDNFSPPPAARTTSAPRRTLVWKIRDLFPKFIKPCLL